MCVCVLEIYVTCNDISVIYVTAQMYRQTEEDVVRTVGPQRNGHFVGFFNVPAKHRHGATPFIRLFRETGGPPFLYGYSEKPPHLVAFYDTLGIRRTYSHLNTPPPRRPHGGKFL